VTAPRAVPSRLLASGIVVVLAGLLCWVLYGLAAGRENHSYKPHGAPPSSVRVERGHTYWLAVPGGVTALRDAGVDPTAPTCTGAAPGQGPGQLQVTPVITKDSTDTRFINRFASFVAASSGTLRVRCTGLGAVYVDNPAGAGFDWSGLWLVLASAALAVGLPLTLAGLRDLGRPGQEHQVEGGVDRPLGAVEDEEIGRPH
jgi:hypothetical protein